MRTSQLSYLAHQKTVFNPHTTAKQARVHKAAKAAAKKLLVNAELKALGMTKLALLRSEIRYLPRILHDDEHIKGVIYGHYDKSWAILVATERRIIFLDKRLLFINSDELTFDVVSGVSYGQVGLFGTVTLHTRMGDYKIRTMNFRCTHTFIEFIESRCVEFVSRERSDQFRKFF